MQYKFKPLEYNELKGTIGERITRSFFRHELAPRLKQEEGWSRVVLSHNDYKRHAPDARASNTSPTSSATVKINPSRTGKNSMAKGFGLGPKSIMSG